MSLYTLKVEAYLSAAWVDISSDLVSAAGFSLKYGIDANGPADVFASAGTLQFTLNNAANNSGARQGYYSPQHASRRSGWGYGVQVRVTFTYSATNYVKFYGKIYDIAPEPGRYKSQRVLVTAYDAIYDLMNAQLRAIALATSATEDTLIADVLAAVPAAAQPLSQALDAGLDTSPLAFDNLSSGDAAAAVLRDVILSSKGMGFVTGPGAFTYKNRHTIGLASSSVTFSDTMIGFSAPSSVEKCYNRIRVTDHPKLTSATATDELYTLPTGAYVEVPAGTTVTVQCDYSDPNTRTVPVGGTAVVTALIAGTHYSAFANSDGSGANLTANISPTLTPYASTSNYVLINTGGSTAYVTVLKVIGKAIRDPGPQIFESYTAQTYGDRLMAIDLPYCANNLFAQSMAEFLYAQYANLSHQIDQIAFRASDTGAFLTQALAREPGDKITVSETVTGISAIDAIIYSVEFTIAPTGTLTCTWGLGPANPFNCWQLGVAGASELDATTVLGF